MLALPVGEGAGLRPSLSVGMVIRSGGMGAELPPAPPPLSSTSDWNSSRMLVDGKRSVHLENKQNYINYQFNIVIIIFLITLQNLVLYIRNSSG